MSEARTPEAEVESMFVERWSPRAFLADPVERGQLESLFEAARWAPSCFNAQPWKFVWSDEGAGREALRGLLVDGNRVWADKAPVVGFVLARRHFERNGKPNHWAEFDAGAAWMSLCLQARMLGLDVHGMGGFHGDRAPAVLGIDADQWSVVAAFVVGRRGEPDALPEDLREREVRSPRKPLAEVHERFEA